MVVFKTEVAKRVIKYYSERCASLLSRNTNRGSIIMVARALGRHGIAFDIVKSYCDDAVERLAKAKKLDEKGVFTIVKQGDAREMDLRDERVDLILTSPPFWDLEPYESVEGQLADIETYPSFLKELGKTISECFRVLKKDKFCAFVVNDFRKGGHFYDFHNDVIKLSRKAGFLLWDIIINVLHSPMVSGVAQREKVRQTVKIHEYILILKKGEEDI